LGARGQRQDQHGRGQQRGACCCGCPARS
jgi:hypothetical protein